MLSALGLYFVSCTAASGRWWWVEGLLPGIASYQCKWVRKSMLSYQEGVLLYPTQWVHLNWAQTARTGIFLLCWWITDTKTNISQLQQTSSRCVITDASHKPHVLPREAPDGAPEWDHQSPLHPLRGCNISIPVLTWWAVSFSNRMHHEEVSIPSISAA